VIVGVWKWIRALLLAVLNFRVLIPQRYCRKLLTLFAYLVMSTLKQSNIMSYLNRPYATDSIIRLLAGMQTYGLTYNFVLQIIFSKA